MTRFEKIKKQIAEATMDEMFDTLEWYDMTPGLCERCELNTFEDCRYCVTKDDTKCREVFTAYMNEEVKDNE